MDDALCPAILKNECVIHVAYERDIMRHAMQEWPRAFRGFPDTIKHQGWRYYSDDIYRQVGL